MFGDPEDKVRGAQGALAKAYQKFEAAIVHTDNEGRRQTQEINALTQVIATKAERKSELEALSAKAAQAYNAIRGLLAD